MSLHREGTLAETKVLAFRMCTKDVLILSLRDRNWYFNLHRPSFANRLTRRIKMYLNLEVRSRAKYPPHPTPFCSFTSGNSLIYQMHLRKRVPYLRKAFAIAAETSSSKSWLRLKRRNGCMMKRSKREFIWRNGLSLTSRMTNACQNREFKSNFKEQIKGGWRLGLQKPWRKVVVQTSVRVTLYDSMS